LYELFRSFVAKAWDSLVELLGQSFSQTVAKQVLEWVNELKEGKLFSEFLEKLYQTGATHQELHQLVLSSPAALEQFQSAIEKVDGLNDGYEKQAKLAEKFLKGLKFLGGVPAAIIPQGKLVVAAVYIILGGYVVLAGADYVDSHRLKLLDRVPGVRRVVENLLISNPS
jgi:hypothetical protein